MIRGSGGLPSGRWVVVALVLGGALVARYTLARRDHRPSATPGPGSPRPPPARRPPAEPRPGAEWPAGPLRAEAIELRFSLVHLDRSAAARAEPLVRALAAKHLPGFRVVKRSERPSPGERTLAIAAIEERYTGEEVALRAKSLDAAARAALEEGRPATAIAVRAPGGDPAALRGTVELVRAAATTLGAAIDDVEPRLLLGAVEFDRKMAEAFDGEWPVVMRHVSIETYDRGDGLARAVTLGMSKFGLPDVVVNGHRVGQQRAVGSVINAVCQWMIERGALAQAGQIDLDLHGLRSARMRELLLADPADGAKQRAVITVARGVPDEGDADNRLMELTFEGPPGTALERQGAVLQALFGGTEQIVHVQHDAALLAESARERERLRALARSWPQRKPGEHLLVKAPFATRSGGTEWMWIEVTAWKGSVLSGALANDPEDVPELREGAWVSVEESKVFDYLLHRADGTEEGNTTAKLLAP